MFDKLFSPPKPLTPQEQERQEKIFQEQLKYYYEMRELHEQLAHVQLNVFEKLEKYLDEQELKKDVESRVVQLITINQAGYEFEDRGYPFSALIVGQADANTTITIDTLGIRYQHNLQEGVNQLNLLDGAKITCDNAVTVVLVYSLKPLKM